MLEISERMEMHVCLTCERNVAGASERAFLTMTFGASKQESRNRKSMLDQRSLMSYYDEDERSNHSDADEELMNGLRALTPPLVFGFECLCSKPDGDALAW
jgi:hypothetical protein